ncbi:transmembrane protein 202 isoform X3 [Talpa occidentalis]|uniref:transmembrane protein 202 isoform X3 n=1 Tax=Talpa occidentalis TaxID=50954 RepID=UPI0018909EE0|nr:transmembrane protein 202 isoform X3 [Talpa occidentalis]
MEKKEQLVMTFYNPDVPKYKEYRQYQRPTLPTKGQQSDSMTYERQKQLVEETQTYTRMFCGGLCGFSLLLQICVSPMEWVQFLVTKNGLELSAGLWVICHHEALCWSHVPKPPSVSLLFCLILFLTQVQWHTRDIMESTFIWTFYINWWSDFLYTFAGIVSFLNHLRARSLPLDHGVPTVIPMERSRLGIGPVTSAPPELNKETSSETETSSEEETTQ